MSQGALFCATRVVLAQPASAMQQPINRASFNDSFMTSAPHRTPTTGNTMRTMRLTPRLPPGPWHEERLYGHAGIAPSGSSTMTSRRVIDMRCTSGEAHPAGCARQRKRPRCFPCKRCIGERPRTGAVTLRDDRRIAGQTSRHVDSFGNAPFIDDGDTAMNRRMVSSAIRTAR